MRSRVAQIVQPCEKSGLGASISTKMHAAGYRVVVTYSPGNKRVKDWLAEQKASGRKFIAYLIDVTDFDSCKNCID
jgi:acetoacetyl-CoA reductase